MFVFRTGKQAYHLQTMRAPNKCVYTIRLLKLCKAHPPRACAASEIITYKVYIIYINDYGI